MSVHRYPAEPHDRRHGPAGYQSIECIRPWLRDEFAFRCVFCLEREQWSRVTSGFEVDHLLPVSRAPRRRLEYANLLYACRKCNALKGDRIVPDPLGVLLESAVLTHENGRIEGLTDSARKLIDILRLDDDEHRRRRQLLQRIAALAEACNPSLHRLLMGFPPDLPDLSRLRPPKNLRPSGVANSYFARRESGQLPATY
jgi:hypothetical protein